MALLELTDLAVHTRHHTLVHEVDLSIERGERVGLIGESGAGKSMLAMAIMGLLPAGVHATGSLRLAGIDADLVGCPDRTYQKIRGNDMCMVFQEPMTALNPLMKVGAQVAEVFTQHGKGSGAQARQRVVEILARVQLPDPEQAAGAYPHELSGGQRQRVMLAMALANEPALLLCDEPTTALDVTVQRQVLDLIDEAVAELGTSLLFITHDLAVVANTCDRVLVMNQGRMVESGPIDEVFTKPQDGYTRALLAASDLDARDTDGRLFTVATAGDYQPPDPDQPDSPCQPDSPDQPDSSDQPDADASRPQVSERPAAETVVRVEGLTRVFGGRKLFGKGRRVEALRGISLDVRAGERLGIVGESGAGKTTLLRLLTGLDQPTSGSIEVVNTPVVGARERDLAPLRRNLQIIFQDPMGSLNPRMTVGEVIGEPLTAPGRDVSAAERRERVRESLAKVGLPADSIDRYPHQFSGGQRQRISIARALVGRPKVLIADEPVSALDVSVRAQVLNLLADLTDEYGLTLLFVSHDLAVVRHLCDRVVVMYQGMIVEQGPTEQIYRDPQAGYTRTLIDSSLSLRQELREQARRNQRRRQPTPQE